MPKRGLFAKTGSTEGREEGEAVSVIASVRALFAGSCLAVTATRVAGSSLGCSFFPCGVACSGCSRFVLGAPLREVLEPLARARWPAPHGKASPVFVICPCRISQTRRDFVLLRFAVAGKQKHYE